MRPTASKLLALSAALPFAGPALAGDVVVTLGAGDGLVVEDSTGSEELLRVDQAPDARVRARRLVLDDDPPFSTDAQLAIIKNVPSGAAPMIMSSDNVPDGAPLLCMMRDHKTVGGKVGTWFGNSGGIHTLKWIHASGRTRARMDADGNCVKSQDGEDFNRKPGFMLGASSDFDMAFFLEPTSLDGDGVLWLNRDSTSERPVFIMDNRGHWHFVQAADLASGTLTDFDNTPAGSDTIFAQTGAPFAVLSPGDWIAVVDRDPNFVGSSVNDGIWEVASVTSGNLITVVGDMLSSETDRRVRIYRSTTHFEVSANGAMKVNGQLAIPSGTDCPVDCEVGEVFMDTDTSADSVCSSSFNGAVCGCYAPDSWGCP